MNNFRLLRADEIDCRVSQIKEKGLSLLLYKDARCDMNILDETVGAMNWQRHHSRDNANCIVSIYDKERGIWVEKEDTGTESNTEAQKGLASDSFKRACFNWGIGRELYTAPFIWITDCEIRANGKDSRGNPKYVCYDKFVVTDIRYDNNGNITGLAIANQKTRRNVYSYGVGKDRCQSQNAPQAAQNASQEAKPQAGPDGNYYCIDCGAQIEPITAPDGKTYGAGKVINRALKKYRCQLCWNCQTKRDNESAAG